MTLSQVNGGGKMENEDLRVKVAAPENEDLRVKVAAPRVLLPYYFRPSICILIVFFFSFFLFSEFHTTYDNTLSITCYSY